MVSIFDMLYFINIYDYLLFMTTVRKLPGPQDIVAAGSYQGRVTANFAAIGFATSLVEKLSRPVERMRLSPDDPKKILGLSSPGYLHDLLVRVFLKNSINTVLDLAMANLQLQDLIGESCHFVRAELTEMGVTPDSVDAILHILSLNVEHTGLPKETVDILSANGVSQLFQLAQTPEKTVAEWFTGQPDKIQSIKQVLFGRNLEFGMTFSDNLISHVSA